MLTKFIVFIFGLVIGSFLNVLIYRLPLKLSILYPGSFCPICHKSLKVLDLLPVISFIIQKGKCRYCGNKIKSLYPLVEILTATIFVALFYKTGGVNYQFILLSIFFAVMLVASFIDLKTLRIPNILNGVAFLLIITLQFFTKNILFSLSGAFICFISLFSVSILSKGNLGGGDIKLSCVIGATLGPLYGLLSIFLASLIGSLVGVVLLLFKIIDRKKAIPFAPFLFLGALSAVFFGKKIFFYLLG